MLLLEKNYSKLSKTVLFPTATFCHISLIYLLSCISHLLKYHIYLCFLGGSVSHHLPTMSVLEVPGSLCLVPTLSLGLGTVPGIQQALSMS